MTKRLKDIIYALTAPGSWISNHHSCPHHDEYINNIIDNDLIKEIREFEAITICGQHIWIRNYPYAYGKHAGIPSLPYRRTRKRFRDYVERKRYELMGKGK